jgi:hypothetical protein
MVQQAEIMAHQEADIRRAVHQGLLITEVIPNQATVLGEVATAEVQEVDQGQLEEVLVAAHILVVVAVLQGHAHEEHDKK